MYTSFMNESIQVAELRANLFDVLDDVEEQGKTLDVSRRGRLVAQLSPVARRPVIDPFAVKQFCDRHDVERLYLFGSILRDDFRPDSDVDVLYETKKLMTFSEICDMEDELVLMFGRKVDLVDCAMIATCTNDHLRSTILSEARVLHGK